MVVVAHTGTLMVLQELVLQHPDGQYLPATVEARAEQAVHQIMQLQAALVQAEMVALAEVETIR
jgi:hypothetical protein